MIEDVITTELTTENMTLLLNLIEAQNTKLDAVLLCLEHVYTMGLFVIGVSAAAIVVLLLYNALKKLI